MNIIYWTSLLSYYVLSADIWYFRWSLLDSLTLYPNSISMHKCMGYLIFKYLFYLHGIDYYYGYQDLVILSDILGSCALLFLFIAITCFAINRALTIWLNANVRPSAENMYSFFQNVTELYASFDFIIVFFLFLFIPLYRFGGFQSFISPFKLGEYSHSS